MWKSILKISLRSLYKNKSYSFINITGLAIGLAVSIFIFMFVWHEISYDKFNENSSNIYRLNITGEINGEPLHIAQSSWLMGPVITEEFPEFINWARFLPVSQGVHIENNNNSFFLEDIFYADSTLFDLFSFTMIKGDPSKALVAPNSLVLTRSTADMLFEDNEPVGKNITWNNTENFTVTGVIEDIPSNSHFNFDALASLSTFGPYEGAADEAWTHFSYITYFQAEENANLNNFTDQFRGYLDEKIGLTMADHGILLDAFLQPLTDIYLHSSVNNPLGPSGNIVYIYILSAIAFLVLLIACINFINLSTAKASRRARESGVRKVLGANRKMLIIQYLSESILICSLSMVIALAIIEISLPFLNSLLDNTLSLRVYSSPEIMVTVILLVILTGILAGTYPAFVLSGFEPVRVLKNQATRGPRSSFFRNTLVVVQFAISVFLLIATGVVYSQLSYIDNSTDGVKTENQLVIPLRNPELQSRGRQLGEILSSVPGVKSAGMSSGVPVQGYSGTSFRAESNPQSPGTLTYYFAAEPEYMNTMELEIIEGRNFFPDSPSDSLSVIVNETLVKKFNLTDPLGSSLYAGSESELQSYTICGVIKDFNYSSLHTPIEPLIIHSERSNFNFITLSLNPGGINETVNRLRDEWESLGTGLPFDYNFLDQTISAVYGMEKRAGKLFIFFSVFAIFISTLGLYGLSSYTTELRKKEIAIRKAHGAKVKQIMFSLSAGFLKWVFIGNMIAWPAAWFWANSWLNNFAYQISVGAGLFFSAGLFSVIIALLTVNYQAFKAAISNPVNALRYE